MFSAGIKFDFISLCDAAAEAADLNSRHQFNCYRMRYIYGIRACGILSRFYE